MKNISLQPEQSFLKEKIVSHFDAAKARNPSYSLRSMARFLGIPAGNLSLFLRDKRAFSFETIEKITYKICKTPEERKDVLEYINSLMVQELRNLTITNHDYVTLSEEEFIQLDNWYYFAFRSLLHLKDFRLDLNWISKRLNIKVEEVQDAMKKLVSMGLITIDENNKVTSSARHLRTPDTNIQKPEVLLVGRKIHKQSLEQSKQSIEEVPLELRDITWVNIPTDTKRIEKAREIIRKFQDDMIHLLEDGDAEEVYRLCIQLYPITK